MGENKRSIQIEYCWDDEREIIEDATIRLHNIRKAEVLRVLNINIEDDEDDIPLGYVLNSEQFLKLIKSEGDSALFSKQCDFIIHNFNDLQVIIDECES